MKPGKPAPNTLLVLLTIFSLFAGVAAVAPWIMQAMVIRRGDALPVLLLSVPVLTIISLIGAWFASLRKNRRAALFLAALPLFRAGVVLVQRLSASG